jgi:preprotein translocase subunit SecF
MKFIKQDVNIDFIGKRNWAFLFSGALTVITIVLLIWRGGPNLGVDFSGGLLIQIKMNAPKAPAEIKEALQPVQLQDSMVQEFGEKGQFEYLIRAKKMDIHTEGLDQKVKQALISRFGEGIEIRRLEMVGPKVGEDLRQKALFAIFYSILLIAIYISGRFELKWLMSIIMAAALAFIVYVAYMFGASVTWLILIALLVTVGLCWFLRLKYAMGAVISLIHDVIITFGFFLLTDREISLDVIAAFLTLVGYSLNDTIVVFDRIRENLRRFRRRDFKEVMNASINQTLSRTMLTGTTTLVCVILLFVFGGGVIHDFAFAMLVGIIFGTYSSIFIASPVLLIWEGGRFAERFEAKRVARK